MQTTVQSCTQFKQGVGKKGPWTLYKVTTQDGQEPTGFDYVNPGDTIEVTQTTTPDGKYTNLNYTKVAAGAPAPAAAPVQAQFAAPQAAPVAAPAPQGPITNGLDPRVVKIWVAIAQQLGVPAETLNGILDGTV